MLNLHNEAVHSKYFCGHEISKYGLENHRVDYATLAKAGDAVLCNRIAEYYDQHEWECINGSEFVDDDDDENWEQKDFYQYYIISDSLKQVLCMWTHETVWYDEFIDVYIWGITHWGTSWDYVLTEIPVDYDTSTTTSS